jgi:hypothetical protein
VKETIIDVNKQLVELPLHEIVMTYNVRHAHIWHLSSYDPESLKNYKKESIIEMAITIVDNIKNNKPVFDNEPTVWLSNNGYEVQYGSTRSIVAKNLTDIIKKNLPRFKALFSEEELHLASKLEEANFAIINRELTDGEKRRENNVRTDQHWLATAIGYHIDLRDGIKLRDIAAKEGISPAKVRDLANLEKLSNKAKSLCNKGVLGQSVAIHLSKLPKSDQKLVVDYIAEKEIQHISSPKRLMDALQNSYTKLSADYPLKAFSLKTKEFPPVEEESWYFKLEEGLFVQHLSKDEEKSTKRFDAYRQAVQFKILTKYPDAKVLDKAKKGMVLTPQQSCLHGKPYLVNGHKLMFGCTSDICKIHRFEIDKDVDISKDIAERLHQKEVKIKTSENYDRILETIANRKSESILLILVSLQLAYMRLKTKGKQLVLDVVNNLLLNDDYHHTTFEVESFSFIDEYNGDSFLIECVDDYASTIMSAIALQWVKGSGIDSLEDDVFKHFNVDTAYKTLVSQEVSIEVAKKMQSISKSQGKKKCVQNNILDMLVHYLGLGGNENACTKRYLLSSTSEMPQPVTVFHNAKGWGISYPDLSIENTWHLSWIAKMLGASKTVCNNITDNKEFNIFINRLIDERAPFIGDYWNQNLEDELVSYEKKNSAMHSIRNWAFEQFKLSRKEMQDGAPSRSIACHIFEGVNKNFEAVINTKMKFVSSLKEYFGLAEAVEKGKKVTDSLLWSITDHWFPMTSLTSAVERTTKQRQEDMKKVVAEESDIVLESPMKELCMAIEDMLLQDNPVIKVNDPNGTLVGVAHYFGKRANKYKVVYACDEEKTVDYLGKKDYEYVRRFDVPEWGALNALVASRDLNVVDYDLIMLSAEKCSVNFVVAYAFEYSDMHNQPWFSDIVRNDSDFLGDEKHVIPHARERNVFLLSEDGRKRMRIVEIDATSAYAVINVTQVKNNLDEEE